MTRETLDLVQAFKIGKGARLIAETPIRCTSSERARSRVKTLAATRVGVVAAFATSGDPDLGEYDEEPTIILKVDRLPQPFEEA